jgi:putative transposase
MARRKPPAIADQLLDQLLAGADAKSAFEKDGLLDELKKALAERALNAEIDHHLETGEADGRVNSRNGYGKCPPARSGRVSRQRDAQRQNGADRHRQDRA